MTHLDLSPSRLSTGFPRPALNHASLVMLPLLLAAVLAGCATKAQHGSSLFGTSPGAKAASGTSPAGKTASTSPAGKTAPGAGGAAGAGTVPGDAANTPTAQSE